MAPASTKTDYHADLTINGPQSTFLTAEGIPMRKYAGGRYGQKVVGGFEISIYINPVVKK